MNIKKKHKEIATNHAKTTGHNDKIILYLLALSQSRCQYDGKVAEEFRLEFRPQSEQRRQKRPFKHLQMHSVLLCAVARKKKREQEENSVS